MTHTYSLSLLSLWRQSRLWSLLVLAVASAGVSVYSLRQNNLTMIALREQVQLADSQDGDVEAALRALREHVHAHMNTNLVSGPNAIRPPIQLTQRYQRLVAAEKERVSTINSALYTEAQNVCEQRFPDSFSGGPRVPCVEEYVASRRVVEQPIPEALYQFDFVSPRWSPDLAGLSLLVSVVFFVLFGLGLLLKRWLRHEFQ